MTRGSTGGTRNRSWVSGSLGSLAALGAGAALGCWLEGVLMDRLVPPGGVTTAELLRRPEGCIDGYVTAPDGCRLAYSTSGTGSPTFVLLHGFASDRQVWARLQDRLAADFRVVAMDLRGHGSSDVRGVDRPIAETHARDVATLITQLDLRDVILVGHALGGMATLGFLVDRPELRDASVRGAALVSTVPSTIELDRAGRRLAPEEIARKRRLWEAFTSALVRSIEQGTWLRGARSDAGLLFVRSLFGRNAPRGPVAAALELAIRTPPVSIAGTLRSIVGFDVLEDLPGVPTSALILAGERDIVTPIPFAMAMERALPGARLHTILGAGHLIMYEEPDLLVRLLREYALTLALSG